jgi:hypothetical protein
VCASETDSHLNRAPSVTFHSQEVAMKTFRIGDPASWYRRARTRRLGANTRSGRSAFQPSSAICGFVGLDHPGGKVLEHLALGFREWSHNPVLRRGCDRAQPLADFATRLRQGQAR